MEMAVRGPAAAERRHTTAAAAVATTADGPTMSGVKTRAAGPTQLGTQIVCCGKCCIGYMHQYSIRALNRLTCSWSSYSVLPCHSEGSTSTQINHLCAGNGRTRNRAAKPVSPVGISGPENGAHGCLHSGSSACSDGSVPVQRCCMQASPIAPTCWSPWSTWTLRHVAVQYLQVVTSLPWWERRRTACRQPRGAAVHGRSPRTGQQQLRLQYLRTIAACNTQLPVLASRE
jgi:hypothetical protein